MTTPMDAGLLKATDRVHLAYASRTGRVMVTYDSDFLQLHAKQVEHTGIAYVRPGSRNIGQLVELLSLFSEFLLPDEMKNRLEYI